MLTLPDDLPERTHDGYTEFLGRATKTRELLIADVRRYLNDISAPTDGERLLDVATSSDIGRGLLRLLRDCEDRQIPHAQAAVNYFAKSLDVSPDLHSREGFSDDAAVFNAVCRHLGREDLMLKADAY